MKFVGDQPIVPGSLFFVGSLSKAVAIASGCFASRAEAVFMTFESLTRCRSALSRLEDRL
jgi:hypothetical protein